MQNDVPINQPTEIKNETRKRVFLILDGCMLLDEKVGDYVVSFKDGIDPDLNKINLDNWITFWYSNSRENDSLIK